MPDVPTGQLLSGSFRSAAMRTTTGWSLAYPHGSRTDARLPVLLTLHGRSGNHRDAFDVNHYDRFLTAAVRSGVPPFAIASVDGGDHSYFHARADGTDPERMILRELLPMLARRGPADRPDRACTASRWAGTAPCCWPSGSGRRGWRSSPPTAPPSGSAGRTAPPGAFDGEQDFADHDVLTLSGTLHDIPTRITVGSDDPFRPGVRPCCAPALGGVRDRAWSAQRDLVEARCP